MLADMAAAGVEAVDCVSVDNALARVADPLFGRLLLGAQHAVRCAPGSLPQGHIFSERPGRRASIACPHFAGFWERSGAVRCALWAPTLGTCTPKKQRPFRAFA